MDLSQARVITEIRLKNWKCFTELKIKCPKITILTGANSSGKSSAYSSLLGALQSHSFPFEYSPNGSYITLGDYNDVVRDHDPNTEIVIGLTFADKASIESCYCRASDTGLPELKRLLFRSDAFTLETIRQKDGEYKCKYKYDRASDSESETTAEVSQMVGEIITKSVLPMRQKKAASEGKKTTTEAELKEYFKKIFKPLGSGSFSFKNRDDFWRKVSTPIALRQYCEGIIHRTRIYEESFNFISPFRLPPERTYYRKAKKALKVDKFGDNCIDQILEWEARGGKNIEKLKTVLRELALVDDVHTKRFEGGRYELCIKAPKRDIPASICDVGFGVSQFLPIVVADLQLGSGSTLLIAQPEIHLHPSVQAQLANYFVSQVKSSSKRYLIETHSDYFLTRLRLLIAQGELAEEDLAVYHLSIIDNKTQIDEVVFQKDGQIKGAPPDFFETYMMDVMNIALAV